jgi:hypothetical protein
MAVSVLARRSFLQDRQDHRRLGQAWESHSSAMARWIALSGPSWVTMWTSTVSASPAAAPGVPFWIRLSIETRHRASRR